VLYHSVHRACSVPENDNAIPTQSELGSDDDTRLTGNGAKPEAASGSTRTLLLEGGHALLQHVHKVRADIGYLQARAWQHLRDKLHVQHVRGRQSREFVEVHDLREHQKGTCSEGRCAWGAPFTRRSLTCNGLS
jgi:hypothetical protein